MTALTMKVINLDEFSAKLKKLSSAVRQRTLHDAVEAGGNVIRANAMVNIERTFSEHSRGELAGSIMVEVESSDKTAEAMIGPTVEYGRIQELGGSIRPVNKKLLSWIDPDTGERVVARAVTLPARPYLRPAVDEHGDEIEEAVAAQVRDAINGAI